MKNLKLAICFLAGLAVTPLVAQQERAQFPPVALPPAPASPFGQVTVGPNGQAVWSKSVSRSASKIRQELAKLKDAESEMDRQDVEDNVREMLSEQFDESLVGYEKKLAAMEERLKEMRKQLQRRRRAKDDLVELRLRTLVNEADGLGWPDSNGEPRPTFRVPINGLGVETTYPAQVDRVFTPRARSTRPASLGDGK